MDETYSFRLPLAVAASLKADSLSSPGPALCHQTMAAADAPFDHLPTELRTLYHTHRLEITLLQSDTIAVFFPRLVLRRWPTYAPSCEHIPCQLSWPSPMPIKYEHLFMELQPQYCPDREDTSPTSYGYTYCYLHPHPEKRTINNGCGLILC